MQATDGDLSNLFIEAGKSGNWLPVIDGMTIGSGKDSSITIDVRSFRGDNVKAGIYSAAGGFIVLPESDAVVLETELGNKVDAIMLRADCRFRMNGVPIVCRILDSDDIVEVEAVEELANVTAPDSGAVKDVDIVATQIHSWDATAPAIESARPNAKKSRSIAKILGIGFIIIVGPVAIFGVKSSPKPYPSYTPHVPVSSGSYSPSRQTPGAGRQTQRGMADATYSFWANATQITGQFWNMLGRANSNDPDANFIFGLIALGGAIDALENLPLDNVDELAITTIAGVADCMQNFFELGSTAMELRQRYGNYLPQAEQERLGAAAIFMLAQAAFVHQAMSDTSKTLSQRYGKRFP